MRLVEILGGLRLPVSNEESALIDLIQKNGSYQFDKLNGRGKQLTWELHKRNIFNVTDDGTITFNKKQDLSDMVV